MTTPTHAIYCHIQDTQQCPRLSALFYAMMGSTFVCRGLKSVMLRANSKLSEIAAICTSLQSSGILMAVPKWLTAKYRRVMPDNVLKFVLEAAVIKPAIRFFDVTISAFHSVLLCRDYERDANSDALSNPRDKTISIACYKLRVTNDKSSIKSILRKQCHTPRTHACDGKNLSTYVLFRRAGIVFWCQVIRDDRDHRVKVRARLQLAPYVVGKLGPTEHSMLIGPKSAQHKYALFSVVYDCVDGTVGVMCKRDNGRWLVYESGVAHTMSFAECTDRCGHANFLGYERIDDQMLFLVLYIFFEKFPVNFEKFTVNFA